MCFCKVHNMDVIPNAGTIRRWIIVSKNVDHWAYAGGYLSYKGK